MIPRYVAVGGRLTHVGCVREASDVDVDGNEVRYLPAPHVRSHTLVTRDGTVRQRYFNWMDGTYDWSKPKDGSKGVSIGTAHAGGKSTQVSVLRAIALAWIDLPPHLTDVRDARVGVLDPSESPYDPQNLGWFTPSDLPRRAIGPPELGNAVSVQPEDAEWRDLSFVEQSTHTLVRQFDPEVHGNVQVSSAGQVRTELGLLTPHSDGTVDVGIFGSLPVADAVTQTFLDDDGSVCGQSTTGSVESMQVLPRPAPHMRTAERQVYDRVLHGESVQEIARHRGCAPGTVYCHLLRALSALELHDIPARVWLHLIPEDVRTILDEMHVERDPLLGDSLKECKEYVEDRLGYDVAYEVLRIGRLYMMRASMHAHTMAKSGRATSVVSD